MAKGLRVERGRRLAEKVGEGRQERQGGRLRAPLCRGGRDACPDAQKGSQSRFEREVRKGMRRGRGRRGASGGIDALIREEPASTAGSSGMGVPGGSGSRATVGLLPRPPRAMTSAMKSPQHEEGEPGGNRTPHAYECPSLKSSKPVGGLLMPASTARYSLKARDPQTTPRNGDRTSAQERAWELGGMYIHADGLLCLCASAQARQ